MSAKQCHDTAPGGFRECPNIWQRHKTLRLVLLRFSDVTDRIDRVTFLSVEQVERFLIEQSLKQKRIAVVRETDYRKRRGKNWQIKL